jgi:DNA-binding transcriptional regulator LsrR (DeoR family)
MPKRTSERPLTDLQKIDITRRYLVRRVEQRVLAEEYQTSSSTINRAIDDVLSKGWLVVSVKQNYALPTKLDPGLMQSIADRYPGVQNVYVVEAPDPISDYAAWSDHVHHVLGCYLGKIVKPGICNDDKIGVSSGRGVYYTIEGIFEDLIRADNVTILSLTGSFGNRAHGLREPTIMDGDTNAALLALGFGRMIRLQTTGREVVVDPSLVRPLWFNDPPNRALVGLGVLEKTNRMLAESPSLVPLRGHLDELASLVAASTRENYIPCADMCNCMLWIPPPKGTTVSNEGRIRKLIDEINAKLYVIPFDNLLRVPSCWLAVGTAKKAHALHHCLQRGLRVNSLCVDTTLAKELLKLSA